MLSAMNQLFGLAIFSLIMVHPDLFNPDFIDYMSNLFEVSAEAFNESLVGVIVVIFTLAAMWNIWGGYQISKKINVKTKVKWFISNNMRRTIYNLTII